MKKLTLLCVALVLLLLVPETREVTLGDSRLGNTVGNIGGWGTVAEDEEFIYYSSYDKNSYHLRKVSKETGEVSKIAHSIHGVGFLNLSENHVFYSDSYLGHICRVRKDGRNRRHITLSRVESFILRGERIYYKKADFKEPREEIYSVDLNGRDRRKLAENVSLFCPYGDVIYYINSADNYSLWKMDLLGENKEKLRDGPFSDLDIDEEYLYYRTEPDRKLFRMDKETLQSECIFDGRCRGMNVSADWIYYNDLEQKGWLFRMSKDGRTKEGLIALPTAETNVINGYVFFRSFEAQEGGYFLDLASKDIIKVSE